MDDAPEIQEVLDAIRDVERFAGASFTGVRRGGSPPVQKVTMRPVLVASDRAVQVSSFDGERTDVENIGLDGLDARASALVEAGFKTVYVKTLDGDLQLTFSKRGRPVLARHPATVAEIDLSHDREKQRLVDPGAPFLAAVGIADDQGRIKPSAADKYRQVARFVELLDHTIADRSPDDGPLHVVDFGCGAGVLTLAAHDHLAHRRGFDVSFVGVDTKADLINRLGRITAELGWEGLRFHHGTIADYEGPRADLVIALHACDTATDDALAQAIQWESTYVLAAPCCQHDLQMQIDPTAVDPAIRPILRDGIMRERFVDLLTDTIRAETLRDHGYRTDVIEFVSTEHTARNLMIRAVRRKGRQPAETHADRLASEWGVRPALAERLDS